MEGTSSAFYNPAALAFTPGVDLAAAFNDPYYIFNDVSYDYLSLFFSDPKWRKMDYSTIENPTGIPFNPRIPLYASEGIVRLVSGGILPFAGI